MATPLKLFLFVLLFPALGLGQPSGKEPLAELARAHADAALQLRASPRAAAHLIRLHGLIDEIEDTSLLAQTYSAFFIGPGADPLAKDVARMLMLELEQSRGRLSQADEHRRRLGYIQDFFVIGGFDNEGKGGCDRNFGPESEVDLKATYPAKGQTASWQQLSAKALDGYVDLSTPLRPNKEVVAYALTYLEAPKDGTASLGVGTSGAFRLWVNGKLATRSDEYHPPRPDQARVKVPLKKGHNAVLLKICQQSGPLGFYLRTGESEVTPRLRSDAPVRVKGNTPAAQRLPTVASAMENAVKERPQDAFVRGEYATVLDYFRPFDDSTLAPIAQAGKAVQLRPKDVNLRLLAAEIQTEDSNLKRKHLEAALAEKPDHPLAVVALAEFELLHDHPERTLALLAPLMEKQPDFPAAPLLLARTYETLGEWPRAAALVEAALGSFPRHPQVLREAARAARRLDRPHQAIERFRGVLSLRYDDLGSRRSLASLLADSSRIDEAIEEIAALLKIDPFDNGMRLRLAELLAANGKPTEADKQFAAARQLSPREPELFEREGRALLQQGRKEEALAAFENALLLRPQNPPLREALRALKGENASPASQYAFDAKSLAGEAEKAKGEDAVYLADYSYHRVQSSGLSSKFHQLAIKVFTQRGVDAFRSFPITYSPDRQEIRVLRARITKPDGSVVESYGDTERNINEPWSGMYYDARARVLSFPALAPGDILELQYRLEDTALDNLLSDYWGDVDYLQAMHPKLHYQFMVDMPAGRTLYWNQSSISKEISADKLPLPDGRTVYRWRADGVNKIVPEPSMPGWSEVAATLHVSTYENWDQVGRYYWGLVRDQLLPNDDIRETVDKLLAGVNRKDEPAVIGAIYNFVVTSTRYVALEFGIHGYKPYRVDRVLARRFGDCKDKASLIHAMLKVAGIDSRLVLLRMRHLGDIGHEPASLAAFNHAIAYVPKYDLFLDGTAEFHGAHELPASDRLANILVVEPEGSSKFFTTPETSADENLTETVFRVQLRADGSAEVKGQSVIRGQSAPEYRRAYRVAATRKATFEQGWAQTFPGVSIQEVSLTDPGKLDRDVRMSYRMRIPRYAEVLTQGLRFHPFAGGRSYSQTYAPLAERKLDLVLQSPWTNRFTFRYALPQGFDADSLPAPVKDETPFGRLELSYRVDGGEVVCEGEFSLSVTRISTKDYRKFRAFLGRVDQAFGRKLFVEGTAEQTAKK